MATTRKTLALAATARLVFAAIGLNQVPANQDGPSPRELRLAVARAHELRARIAKLEDQDAKSAAEKEFRKVIFGSRELFPEVVTAPGDRASYTKLTLNSRGGGFDAFRFRVPSAGRTYQLYLSFLYPGTSKTHNIAALNIVEVKGEDLILTYPEVKENVTIAGMRLPEPNWWSQYRLYGRKLQAGREYFFYFDLKSDEPFPIFVRVRIEPLETAEPPHTPALQTARGTFQTALEKLNERLRRRGQGHPSQVSRGTRQGEQRTHEEERRPSSEARRGGRSCQSRRFRGRRPSGLPHHPRGDWRGRSMERCHGACPESRPRESAEGRLARIRLSARLGLWG